MIRDVVGGADEFIERQDRVAMPGMDQQRRHGKIFVSGALAGSQLVRRLSFRPRGLEAAFPQAALSAQGL